MDVDGFLQDLRGWLVDMRNGDFELRVHGATVATLEFQTRQNERELELALVYVRPLHRRRGVAKTLLTRVCALADARDVGLALSVLDHRPSSLPPFAVLRRLYARCGFVFDGLASRGDDYRMRRPPAATHSLSV